MKPATVDAIEISKVSIPDDLLAALERQRRYLTYYTDAKTVYCCIDADYRNISVGVFGDGSNGAYEWFIWDEDSKSLRTSDCGYGCPGVALCCGLVESGARHSKGDHDVILTWKKLKVARKREVKNDA